jgi:carotenoid cleavage dioxygenase-like enzyme
MTGPTRRTALGLGMMATAIPLSKFLAAFAATVADDPVAAAFADARKTKAWTLGFEAPRSRDLDTGSLERLSGALPKGFEGVLYRNGPALFERAGYRYRHWFDGDGMVHRYHFANGTVSHRGRYVATKKLALEEAAGRFIVPTFGSQPDPNPTVNGPDDVNAANTSVLPLGDEVLALWEAGSAYALDGATLETHGPKLWRPDLAGMPFSAHPKRMLDGTIYNFGADAANDRVVLYRISEGGSLQDVRLLALPRVGLMHDFLVTQKSFVFLAGSYRTVRLTLPYIDSFAAEPTLPVLVMATPIEGGPVRTWELPPGFVFHFGNAFEEADGTIRLDAAWYTNIRYPKEGPEALMRGVAPEPGPARLGYITLRPGKPHGEVSLSGDGEFPRIDPRLVGVRHDAVFHTAHGSAPAPAHAAVVRRDWSSGATSSFDYGALRWAEEHIYVPSGGSEHTGHLVGTVLNLATKRTELHILDAARLDDGPVASFALPYPVPLGFHGAWKAA